jgi:ATP-dependent DNA helicase DinG
MPLVSPSAPPLPAWVQQIRPSQAQAVEEVLSAYERGCRLVVLDAPTGAGKTLIAELVRRGLDPAAGDDGDPDDEDEGGVEDLGVPLDALYICSGLALQDQFARDFPYARVVKGKGNYIPTDAYKSLEAVTCADCDAKRVDGRFVCSWCEEVNDCPYRVAKREAVNGDLACVNTAYALREWSAAGALAGRGLVIADECDTLESQLLGYCQFRLSEARLKALGLQAPKKGTHQTTIKRWMADELLSRVREQLTKERGVGGLWGQDVNQKRKVKRLVELATEITTTLDRMEDGEWVRADEANRRGIYTSLTLKPVMVAEHGAENLWLHGNRWLCMSATVISADQMVAELGVPPDWAWELVQVPMRFPVENRRVCYAGVGRLTKKTKDEVMPKVTNAVVQLVKNHPGERVLVHSVSYHLTGEIKSALGRTVISYQKATEREAAVALFRRTEGAVLVAPSLERGVDLADDACRVQIVAKIPFPYLGDKQVSARVNAPGGEVWYKVETIRSLVQMTGRGVRSADDWCVTYVLDASLRDLLEGRGARFFPKWWRDAVDWRFNRREAGLM